MYDLLMYTDIQNYHEIECLAKTRMKSDGAYCVYLVRVDFDHEIPEELIIGHDDGSEDYKFDPYGKEKYESIYSREPYEIDGVLITPPKKIGVFA